MLLVPKNHCCNNPGLCHYCDIWIVIFELVLTLPWISEFCPSCCDAPASVISLVKDTNCPTVWSAAKTSNSSYKPCGSYVLTSKSPHSMNHWLEKQQLSFATAGVWEGSTLSRRRRRRGASGASCAHHPVHGAGEPDDVTEFLKTAGAFHLGLLWHLFT